jgi:hypothetical protein
VAARTLVDLICGVHDVPLLVLHDFDKSGFSILGTLQRATRRFRFQHTETYRAFIRSKRVERIMAEEIKKHQDVKVDVPGDLRNQVEAHLAEHPEVRWDEAVRAIVDEADKALTVSSSNAGKSKTPARVRNPAGPNGQSMARHSHYPTCTNDPVIFAKRRASILCDVAYTVEPEPRALTWSGEQERYWVLRRWSEAVLKFVPKLAALAGLIEDRCRREGFAWANNTYFAKRLGVETRTIQRQLSKLQEVGAIACVRVGARKRKTYPLDAIVRRANSGHTFLWHDKNVTPPMYDKNITHKINNKHAIKRPASARSTGGMTARQMIDAMDAVPKTPQ